MSDRFENQLDWVALGGAFAIWAAHFMLAWSIVSIFPGKPIVVWLTLALTAVALGALASIWRKRAVASIRSVPGLAIAVAGIAVLYVFLPAVIT